VSTDTENASRSPAFHVPIAAFQSVVNRDLEFLYASFLAIRQLGIRIPLKWGGLDIEIKSPKQFLVHELARKKGNSIFLDNGPAARYRKDVLMWLHSYSSQFHVDGTEAINAFFRLSSRNRLQ
jgi:hypothetical protein